ncbi:MAG: YqiA/YcfP family alpha/beta fold hydrolase [Pseudomonadota bacterium]
MSTTHLLYLHGFRSSPHSAKARLMAERVQGQYPQVTWWCPQLPASPREAMALVERGVATWPRQGMAVIGSSLGGFYAGWVQHRTGCARSVLLNPAVDPARDLARYIGEQTVWHDPQERFFFLPEFVDELRALVSPPQADPARQLAFVARGDEVLDWREMAARCAGATLHVLEGGDHALSDFPAYIDTVCRFLDM